MTMRFSWAEQDIADSWATETTERNLEAILRMYADEGNMESLMNVCRHYFQNGFRKGRAHTQGRIVAALGLRNVSFR